MKKIILVGLAVAMMTLALACSGGGTKEEPTATSPAATATEAGTQSETPPSSAELAAYFTTIKAVMEDTIDKANAGDVQGTQDAEAQGDDAIEAIINALRTVDADLADQIETLELTYEEQADSDNPDLTVIAQAAQGVLDLLDQAASALGIEMAPSSADLAGDFTTIKAVMEDTIAKANAGDVQGTQDAEAQGDEAIEAIIDALRAVDADLADQIETLELTYEEQADSDSPDLTVIAQAAQGVLDLLDQAASALGVSP